MKSDNDGFKDWLNQRATELNLTDLQIAELVDVSVPSIRRWRSGETTPMPAFQKLARQVLKEQE